MSTCTVVINTNRPAPTLLQTLEGLELLDPLPFDVVIVRGPHVAWAPGEVASQFPGARIVDCPTPNISVSRNIGIANASGEFVAFIDDDAVPEPDWLLTLLEPFRDLEVAAVGGPVLNHTGAAYQAVFSTVTRGGLARSFNEGPNPSAFLNAPSSWAVPTTMGTNSVFRRETLIAVGGFDEEIEYYLDESELCIRLIDAGWRVELLDRGRVHHKFLPSSTRGEARAVTDWYPIVKNTAYVACRHGFPTGSLARCAQDLTSFYEAARRTTWHHERAGDVPPGALRALDGVLETAPAVGQAAAKRPARLGSPRFVSGVSDVQLFGVRALPPGERLHLCLLAQDYPPGPVGGIGRVIADVAPALAARGHVVRVITRHSEEHHTVDLEDGVWVHRLPRLPCALPGEFEHRAYADSVNMEVQAVHARRRVDIVYAPNWDAEGLAVIRASEPPVALGLYTPVAMLSATDSRVSLEEPHIQALIHDEIACYSGADHFVACGEAIVDDVSHAYGLTIDRTRLTISPHGLRDTACPSGTTESHRSDDVLVVGRLEPRKGTDVILGAAESILQSGSGVRLVFAGNDQQPSPDGRRYTDVADALVPPHLRPRVVFLGEISDDELLERYRTCAVVVVPSRFESFGLPAIEAMRAAVPVVVSATGGLAEIVEDGVTGTIVAPDDPEALARAVVALLADRVKRDSMGATGRARFEEQYSVEACASRLEACFRRVAAEATLRP